MRRETRVTIYFRVKHGTKWGRKKAAIPGLKIDGTLFLKDDRQGILRLCWHEGRQKQWQSVKGRVSENELPFLSDAITQQAGDRMRAEKAPRRLMRKVAEDKERRIRSTRMQRERHDE
jgi:hypothetical protein